MEEVINTIKRRYIHERAIYTWCGIALVAVNPYQDQDIYGEQVVETYHSASHSVYLQLDPHIYAVTEDAYSKLELNSKDQSIIVSGESGAGKTVSAKHAMRYLASIASSHRKSSANKKSSLLTGNNNNSSSTNNSNAVQRIEQRVLASNPIMEAIGNARTVRNDNSSRFGKYIQIYFDRHQRRILGANMRTYLLEKSRVTKQQVGERNFHIFYQLLNYAQKHPDKLAHLKLLDPDTKQPIEFKYLNPGNMQSQTMTTTSQQQQQDPTTPVNTTTSSNIKTSHQSNDLRRFNEAMRTLNIDEKRIQLIYRIISGILHGGNIVFKSVKRDSDDNEEDCGCEIDPESDLHFKACCELIGLNSQELAKRMTTRLLRSGPRDVIEKPQSCRKAEYSRDAMLKFIYECLFTWLVALINLSLGSEDPNNPNSTTDLSHILAQAYAASSSDGNTTTKSEQNSNKLVPNTQAMTPKSPSAKKSILDHLHQQQQPQFIGVLDIYGFENFQTNSFEQFCINYANEVLQQQYNQHVFKIEQEEYIREGIDWTFIEYSDNQPVIDIIETRPIGILNLLDEECKMPKGTDESWCAKLYEQLLPKVRGKKQLAAEEATPFKKPKLNYQTSFTISHYAEDVNYSVESFLEKNRDSLAEEQCEMLKSSEVLSFLFEDPRLADHVKPKMRTARSATVGWQFRGSLSVLIKTLNATEPHYIRCIKPNDDKRAFEFNEKRAIEQLRACGVYETIRISNNGFPLRWSYKDFAKRYCVLIYGTPAFEELAHRSSLTALGNMNLQAEQEVEQTNISGSQPDSLESRKSNDSKEKKSQRLKQYEFIQQQRRHYMCQFSSADVRPICEAICKIAYADDFNSMPYAYLRTDEEQKYIDKLIERHGNKSLAIYQFGKSKLFFRAGQVGYLERIRSQRLREYSVTIQRHVRGWLARRLFAIKREEHYERLRREATLASLQEQALLEQAELEARLEAERLEAARIAAETAAASIEDQKLDLETKDLLDQMNNALSMMDSTVSGQDRISFDQSSSISTLNDTTRHQHKVSSSSSCKKQSQSTSGNLYNMVVDMMYASIQPLIISAVLEYEALDQPEPFSSLDSQTSSRSQTPEQLINEQSMESLIKELDRFYDLIRKNSIPEHISVQAFKQIFYLICAHSLNQLLIRRDLCQFRKAMQINFNLSCLVQWCRERYLVKWKEIIEQLDPITQATKLLQTRKSSEDIATIEEVCNKLRPSQIIKILNLYTSSYEEQITTDFIHELEEYLNRTRSIGLSQDHHHHNHHDSYSGSSGFDSNHQVASTETTSNLYLETSTGTASFVTSSNSLIYASGDKSSLNQMESLDDENNNTNNNTSSFIMDNNEADNDNNGGVTNFNQNDLYMDTKHYFPFVDYKIL